MSRRVQSKALAHDRVGKAQSPEGRRDRVSVVGTIYRGGIGMSLQVALKGKNLERVVPRPQCEWRTTMLVPRAPFLLGVALVVVGCENAHALQQQSSTQELTPTSATCAAEMVSCSGLCTSLVDDPHNCGVCGASCAVGARCVHGTCVAPVGTAEPDPEVTRPRAFTRCPVGFGDCGSGCVDFRNDRANCGHCLSVCTGMCSLGHCS